MEEISEYSKERLLKADFWAFVSATIRHWHLWLGYFFGLGLVCLLAAEEIVIPHWGVPWLAALGLVIAAFFAWRDERRLKEAAEFKLSLSKPNSERNATKPRGPQTLHEMFNKDFPYLATGSTAVMHKTNPEKTPLVTIEYKLWQADDANAEFLSIFIPKSPDTFGICATLASGYLGLMDKIRSGVKVVQGSPADYSNSDSADLVFTRKIYIYHEDDLTLEQLGQLDGLFKSKNLFVQFRAQKYATVRWLQNKS